MLNNIDLNIAILASYKPNKTNLFRWQSIDNGPRNWLNLALLLCTSPYYH